LNPFLKVVKGQSSYLTYLGKSHSLTQQINGLNYAKIDSVLLKLS
jgi:hypothetical protein